MANEKSGGYQQADTETEAARAAQELIALLTQALGNAPGSTIPPLTGTADVAARRFAETLMRLGRIPSQ